METLILQQDTLLGSPWIFCKDLADRGIAHGFLGKPLDFSLRGGKEVRSRLCGHFGAQKIIMLNQVHGGTVIEAPCFYQNAPVSADGMFFKLQSGVDRQVFAIQTADCVPMLIVGKSFGAVIHAGWRGFAAKIIERALALFSERDSLPDTTALIGPSAGPGYEVGQEVLDAIGSGASVTSSGKGKYLLNLEATALKKLSDYGVGRSATSGLYTLSDERFFSARREGIATGRNLSFISV